MSKLQVAAAIKKSGIDCLYLVRDNVSLKLTQKDWEEINNTLKGKYHVLATIDDSGQINDYQPDTIVYN